MKVKGKEAKEIHDLDTIQIRNGDTVVIRPRSRMDMQSMKRINDFVTWWKERHDAKFDVMLVNYDLEVFILRPKQYGDLAEDIA